MSTDAAFSVNTMSADTMTANDVCTSAHMLPVYTNLAEEEGNLEVHNLSIKMPFKLHGQLTQLVHSEPGSMYARGKQELTIWRGFHAVACCWELQILHQLNLSPASRQEDISNVEKKRIHLLASIYEKPGNILGCSVSSNALGIACNQDGVTQVAGVPHQTAGRFIFWSC